MKEIQRLYQLLKEDNCPEWYRRICAVWTQFAREPDIRKAEELWWQGVDMFRKYCETSVQEARAKGFPPNKDIDSILPQLLGYYQERGRVS